MIIDAEFTVKIKLPNMPLSNNVSGLELRQRIMEEGEKRLRYYTSGYLLDPDAKIIKKEVSYEIKEQ